MHVDAATTTTTNTIARARANIIIGDKTNKKEIKRVSFNLSRQNMFRLNLGVTIAPPPHHRAHAYHGTISYTYTRVGSYNIAKKAPKNTNIYELT